MKNSGSLTVRLPSDCEIVLTRVFRAPRQLVHDAFGKPEILKRWFGPRGWTLETCETDLRVGGGFRFVLCSPAGLKVGMRGTYLELLAPERSVHTEQFDHLPGECRVTSELLEHGGQTTLRVTLLYPSKESRDAAVESGMEHGAAESYDRLAEVLG